MNRRSFLRTLCLGLPAAAVAPVLASERTVVEGVPVYDPRGTISGEEFERHLDDLLKELRQQTAEQAASAVREMQARRIL